MIYAIAFKEKLWSPTYVGSITYHVWNHQQITLPQAQVPHKKLKGSTYLRRSETYIDNLYSKQHRIGFQSIVMLFITKALEIYSIEVLFFGFWFKGNFSESVCLLKLSQENTTRTVEMDWPTINMAIFITSLPFWSNTVRVNVISLN